MCKHLEINSTRIYFALLLITLNVPLRIGNCTPGGTCTPGWESLFEKVVQSTRFFPTNTSTQQIFSVLGKEHLHHT